MQREQGMYLVRLRETANLTTTTVGEMQPISLQYSLQSWRSVVPAAACG